MLSVENLIQHAEHYQTSLLIVAYIIGGNRANIIHYVNNNQLIHGDELVLMDAGCEYNGYTSDITRTWPVSGMC